MDISKPINNPKLLELMHSMNDDKSKVNSFIDELLKVKLLCPTLMRLNKSSDDGNNKITLNEGTTIQLLALTSKTKQNYLMAFTDWNELRQWRNEENQQTLIFSFDDYKSIVMQKKSVYDGFVINPYGENIVLDKNSINNISQGSQIVNKGESVMLGEPKDYPNKMVNKLKECFEKIGGVKRAYLLWMVRGGKSSYLLVLEIEGVPQDIFPKIADVCKPYLKGKLLDMIPMDTVFGKSAIENKQPFYIAL